MKRFLRYIKEAELGFPGDESDKLYYSGGKEVKPKMSAEDEEHWSQHSLMPQPNEPGTNKSRYNVGHLRQLANMHPENHPNRLHFERKYGHLADTVTASPDQHPMDLEMDFHMLARSTRMNPAFYGARLGAQAEKETREMGQEPLLNHAEKIGRVLKESMDTLFPYKKIRDDQQTVEHDSGPPTVIHHIHHEITLPDDSTIKVEKRIEPNHYQDGEREMNVKFFAGDSQKLTGKGKYQFGVLNTVRHITQQTAEDHGIDTVKYSVSDGPTEKRKRVYDKIAQRVGAQPVRGSGIPRLKIEV